jgi:hypothetical protein
MAYGTHESGTHASVSTILCIMHNTLVRFTPALPLLSRGFRVRQQASEPAARRRRCAATGLGPVPDRRRWSSRGGLHIQSAEQGSE